MNTKGLLAIIAGVVVLYLVSATVYIVPETHRGVVLRFGELVKTGVEPGLHFKLPWVETAEEFDTRILTLNIDTQRYLTIEKKPLDVDSYVTWQIIDVADFYRATGGSEMRAEGLLASRIENGLRDEFGVRNMTEVVSGARDELMKKIQGSVDELTRKEFGIRVQDIRIKGIELPDEVSETVYQRMRTERQAEAQEYRSRGREQAEGVRAAADRKVTVLLAEANREAQETRGEGDGKAATIYAEAYGQDQEFYELYRTLEAYRSTFNSRQDVFLMDSQSDFMNMLDGPMGGQ
ncbi:protease modulator HflC [Halospina sp. K52047b]|uniref:protease modulator HflC n=1 Tax=Halospina sp. K52047b TaxID=2614160 RepID=UPI00124A711B|nr:protease modulator HflC [Halospina sp. K52047b]KAA8979727.1 protease modulator HflC [Halospina sp. K52047b]